MGGMTDLPAEGELISQGWVRETPWLPRWPLPAGLGASWRPDRLLRITEHFWASDLKSVTIFSLTQIHIPSSLKPQLSSFVCDTLFIIVGLFYRIWKVECWGQACFLWQHIWWADGLWGKRVHICLVWRFLDCMVFLVEFPPKASISVFFSSAHRTSSHSWDKRVLEYSPHWNDTYTVFTTSQSIQEHDDRDPVFHTSYSRCAFSPSIRSLSTPFAFMVHL